MKYDLMIGIDPGVSNGGIAIKRDFAKTYRCPREFKEMRAMFRYIKNYGKNPLAFIEVVQLFSTDSKTPGKQYGLQKLFRHFNSLKNALESENIPYVEVYPQSWQSFLKLKTKQPESDRDRKNRYKRAAQNYFPEERVTLWNSDALLLMYFGIKKIVLDPDWIKKRMFNPQN